VIDPARVGGHAHIFDHVEHDAEEEISSGLLSCTEGRQGIVPPADDVVRTGVDPLVLFPLRFQVESIFPADLEILVLDRKLMELGGVRPIDDVTTVSIELRELRLELIDRPTRDQHVSWPLDKADQGRRLEPPRLWWRLWSALSSEESGFWTATLGSGEEDSVGRRGGPGRRGYPVELRRRVVDLLDTGRKVADVARDLGVSEQAIYGWRRQERVDRGLEPGLGTAEQAELAVAKRRIRELEAELAVHRRAAELLKETNDPKVGSRPSA